MLSFFSVIIPTYNRGAFISDAIQSVVGQTFQDFEIIIVDDGSTDDTEQVVKSITDSRVRYFKKKNEERSIARNYGIAKATGRYINFLDSDDLFYPNHLDAAYNLLQQKEFPEVAHLGFELIRVSDGLERKVLVRRNDLNGLIPERMLHENILHGNAIFIRKEIAIEYPFLNSKDAFVSEDWYVWMRLISRYPVHYNNTVTSAVIDHAERSLRTFDTEKLIRCTELIVQELKKDQVFMERFFNRTGYFFSNQYTFVTLILALNKRNKKSVMIYLVKAIKEDPTVVFRKRFLASVKYFLFPFLIKQTY